jgi:hypothetical protein
MCTKSPLRLLTVQFSILFFIPIFNLSEEPKSIIAQNKMQNKKY